MQEGGTCRCLPGLPHLLLRRQGLHFKARACPSVSLGVLASNTRVVHPRLTTRHPHPHPYPNPNPHPNPNPLWQGRPAHTQLHGAVGHGGHHLLASPPFPRTASLVPWGGTPCGTQQQQQQLQESPALLCFSEGTPRGRRVRCARLRPGSECACARACMRVRA